MTRMVGVGDGSFDGCECLSRDVSAYLGPSEQLLVLAHIAGADYKYYHGVVRLARGLGQRAVAALGIEGHELIRQRHLGLCVCACACACEREEVALRKCVRGFVHSCGRIAGLHGCVVAAIKLSAPRIWR